MNMQLIQNVYSLWLDAMIPLNEQYSFPIKTIGLLNFTMSLKFKERTVNEFDASLKG